MFKKIKTAAVAIAAALALSGIALAHEHGGSLEARQHGYEHGYRDGFHHGREDRLRRSTYDYGSDDYRHGDRGYEKYMGKREEFRDGYRQGYVAGYDDGYNGRQGRFSEIYGVPYDGDPGRRYDNDRDDEIYERRGFGVSDVAYDIGYRDGLEAARNDRTQGKEFHPEKHDRYEDADHGYRGSYGDKQVYKQRYRQGFLAGYGDGYGLRQP